MNRFVKVIVNYFSQINNAPFLNLHLCTLVQFNSGSMHKSEVSDVVLAIHADNHELSFPQFLIIGNLVVVCFSLSNFEDCSVSLEIDFNILKFLCVNTFEFEL